jgi:ribosomal protein S10
MRKMNAKIYIILKSFEVPQSQLNTILGLKQSIQTKECLPVSETTELKLYKPSTSLKALSQNYLDSDSEDFLTSAIPNKTRRRTVGLHSVRLPKTRALYTVLRSPHIDKKSREQFEMKVYKQLIVIHTKTIQLRKQLLNLKLHDLSGVQLKVIFNYTTRLLLKDTSAL